MKRKKKVRSETPKVEKVSNPSLYVSATSIEEARKKSKANVLTQGKNWGYKYIAAYVLVRTTEAEVVAVSSRSRTINK